MTPQELNQKAEEYAAKIIANGQLRNAWNNFHTVALHDALTAAVMHGVEMGIEGFDANLRKELAKGFILTLNEEGGLSFVKPKDLDL